MNILVLLAHPNKSSFNHAIAAECLKALEENGHDVEFRDLYDEQFDPVLPYEEISRQGRVPDSVREHGEQFVQADGIIIVHPTWWGQPPAILKGWIDRTIRPGEAYEYVPQANGLGRPRGLIRARAAMVFNTGNSPAIGPVNEYEDPLQTLWRDVVFGVCGVHHFHRRVFGPVIISTRQQRIQWLEHAHADVASTFPQTN